MPDEQRGGGGGRGGGFEQGRAVLAMFAKELSAWKAGVTADSFDACVFTCKEQVTTFTLCTRHTRYLHSTALSYTSKAAQIQD